MMIIKKLEELRKALAAIEGIKHLSKDESDYTRDNFGKLLVSGFGCEDSTKALVINKEAILSSLLKIFEGKVSRLRSEAVDGIADEIVELDEIRASLQVGDFDLFLQRERLKGMIDAIFDKTKEEKE